MVPSSLSTLACFGVTLGKGCVAVTCGSEMAAQDGWPVGSPAARGKAAAETTFSILLNGDMAFLLPYPVVFFPTMGIFELFIKGSVLLL